MDSPVSSSDSGQTSMQHLTPSEFWQQPSPPRLIDVRSSLEFRQFHAPGADNLSLPRILLGQVPWLRRWVLPEWFRHLSPQEPVALVCLTSHRSPIAARAMTKAGFRQVGNITGGMMAWRKAGLPIEPDPQS